MRSLQSGDARQATTRRHSISPINPRGAKADHQNQDAAVNDQTQARGIAGDQLGALRRAPCTTNAPTSGPNTVPTPPMIGVSNASMEIQCAVGDAGIDEQKILRIEAAGRGGNCRRYDHGAELDRARH